MHQQNRLSPVSSSPLHHNQIITQQLNRQQCYQQTTPNSKIPQVKTKNFYDPLQQQKERENLNKQLLVSKALKSTQQNDGSNKQINIQYSQTNQNTLQNLNISQCISYFDNALRTQKDELLKLIEQQNKQIENLYSQQQIILQQERKKEQDYETQLTIIKNQLKTQINSKCSEIFNKVQKQQQSDFKLMEIEITKLNQLIQQTNMQNYSHIRQIKLSQNGKENESQEFQEKQAFSIQQNSSINPDIYNKKKCSLEIKNLKLIDPQEYNKLPEQVSVLLNSNNQSSSEIQEIELIQSELPLFDVSNQQNQEQNLQIIPFSSQLITTSNTKQNKDDEIKRQDSPFKNLNEQDMIDSLDDIVFLDSDQKQSNINEFHHLKSKGMSVIQEDEDDDEELIYQIDENGFILTQDGHPLIDEKGKRIQLTKQEIQFYKVQTLN